MTKRSRHRPTDTTIDREWPNQIALPDDLCYRPGFELILEWFKANGFEHIIRRVQAVWPDGKYESFRLHCFRDEADAGAFQAHYGGIRFDPKKDRENGRVRGVWQRSGEYRQMTESGPLQIHPIFLRGPGNMEYD